MQQFTDVVDRLRREIDAHTVWLIKANRDDLDIISVGGYYTDRRRVRLPRANSFTDQVLASGQDVLVLEDLWSVFLNPAARVVALSAQAESSLSVVVRVEGRAWGVIACTSRKSPCPLNNPGSIDSAQRAAAEIGHRLELAAAQV